MGTLLVVSNERRVLIFKSKENRNGIKVNFQFVNVNKVEDGKLDVSF